MLIVALIWSSLGTGLMSAPAKGEIDTTLVEGQENGPEIASDTMPEAPGYGIQKPYLDGGDSYADRMRPNSMGGWYYEPEVGPWGEWSYRDAHNVEAVSQMGYNGNGVVVALADTGIDFASKNLEGKYMIDNNTDSPYYGWPVAFDALSLPQYLTTKEARIGSGGIANTSLNGTGPFNIDHTIKIDGQKDFLRNEMIGTDVYDDIKTPGTATGNEFDLTELWATRDSEFWYAGIKTRNAGINRTFGLSFDFDGSQSGAIHDPYGNLLDFEASHSAPVEQISYNSVHKRIATCSASGQGDAYTNGFEQNSVKIWDALSGALLKTLDNEPYPVTSVVWSPNGTYIAYQTSVDLVLYNTVSWSEFLRITHSTVSSGSAGPNFREALAFSPTESKLVAGSLKLSEILVLDLTTGTHSTYPTQQTPRSVSFSQDGSKIALGLSGGIIQILDSTNYNTLMSLIAPGIAGTDDTDTASVETLAWNSGGTQFATGRDGKGTIDIWDLGISDNRFQWGGENSIIMNVELDGQPRTDRFYLRAIPNEITANGLTAYELGTNGTTGDVQFAPVMDKDGTHSWGMRLWKRSAAGVETEITNGWEAIVTRDIDGNGPQVSMWSPPSTPMDLTDSLVLRIYQGRNITAPFIPTVQVAEYITQPLNTNHLNSTVWEVSYFTRRSSADGAISTRLVGHGGTVNSVLWNSTSMLSGSIDGTVLFRNPTTFAVTNVRDTRYNSPVLSLAIGGGSVFVGTSDCTVRRYPLNWATYTALVAHKPDVMIYIPYEREYYIQTSEGLKLDIEDQIMEPIVFKWSGTAWIETNMTNILGSVFYKGNMAGEWTEHGFIEIALPRNFTAWPNQNEVFINSFICGGEYDVNGNIIPTRPQDTVPSDCNVPSALGKTVDWTGTRMTTLSAWSRSLIPKVSVVHSDIPSSRPLDDRLYHFGYHPSASLSELYGQYVPMIVVESTTTELWDTVYVDMNRDYVIDAKDIVTSVSKNKPVLGYDIWDRDLPQIVEGEFQDGAYDISGGMLYFIGDGIKPLPYSQRMAEVLLDSGEMLEPFTVENPMPIPGNGEIVAFFGDMDFDIYDSKIYTHGTQMASAIAGDGFTRGEFSNVKGVSPEITFLPICNAHHALDYALFFAVEGYDGKPNTGDEANIVSLGQYFKGYGSGFEATTQLVEYLVNYTYSRAVFISPSGDDGSGYGTVAAPCGMNTLVVGFAEDNTFVSSGGNVHHQGAVSELSSRGPTAAGISKPDVIALGMGNVEIPLGASGSIGSSVGGAQYQTRNWKSSDLATAVTTGVMALVFEAYKDKHGSFPSTEIAMNIIRSSAKDLGYDSFTQGSGFVDALAAVNLAKSNAGLLLSAPRTSFGNTFGIEYSSFVNVVSPGTGSTIPVSVSNPRTITQNSQYAFEYMTKIREERYEKLIPSTMNGYRGDISGMIPLNAEVVKVSAQTAFSWTEPTPTGLDNKTFLTEEGSFLMKLWDWQDAEPANGVVDQTDHFSYLTGSDYGGVNSLICTLSNPIQRTSGNLVVEIAQAKTSGIKDRVWNITVESFATMPMPWISLSKNTGSIDGGKTDSVDVNLSVPADAYVGSYGGSFVTTYGPAKGWGNTTFEPRSLPESEYLNTVLQTTLWDDGSQGNYWSDYTARYPDATNDGTVWDTPYAFNTPGKMDNYPLVNQLDTHSNTGPVSISGNSQFASYAVAGDGTIGNPWLIANLIIQGNSGKGIEITGTDDYFMIMGCEIYNMGSSGIYMDNVMNGVITGCEIHDNGIDGISVFNTANVLIDGNIVMNNGGHGINAISVTNLNINGNEIYGNDFYDSYSFYGINLETSDGNRMTGNELYGNGFFAILMSGNNNVIDGNYIHDELEGLGIFDFGTGLDGNVVTSNKFQDFSPDWSDPSFPMYLTIWISGATNTIISGNDFIDCDGGVDAVHVVDDSADTTCTGNYWSNDPNMDGTPFLAIDSDYDSVADVADTSPASAPVSVMRSYHTPIAPITISGDGDFAMSPGVVGGSGTANDPYIISGWIIDTTGFPRGIFIEDTDAYFVIMDCIIHGNMTGTGIHITNAFNGSVISNRMHTLANGVAAMFTNTLFISYNSIDVSDVGISLNNADMCQVAWNHISGASVAGIWNYQSDWSLVDNNMVNGCAGDGIMLAESSDCEVSYNTLENNGYGIHLANATGFNTIHHNNIIGNIVQAYDDFVGDTLATFQIPGDFASTFNVDECNITINGVPLTEGVDYTVDYVSGFITFTPALVGRSGGNELIIRASLIYDGVIPSIIKLPDTRLTDANIFVNISVMKLDGSVVNTPLLPADYSVNRRTGLIEIFTNVSIEKGVTIRVSYIYSSGVGILPMTINVITAENADFSFGDMGADPSQLGTGIMPVWGVRAGQGNSLQSGDRRYYYVWVPNQGMFGVGQLDNFYLYTELQWLLNQTDINIVIYGKGGISSISGTVAPYILNKLGGSEEKADFSPLTATYGPKDILVTNFNHELLTICVSAKNFNGQGNAISTFEGKGGWLKLSDKQPKAWTNSLVGELDVSFHSSVELSGLYASVVGPAQGTKSTEEIYQDDLTLYDLSTLEGWLTMNAVAGFTKVFSVKNALSWDVRIQGHPECPDLDLAVFLDGLNGQPVDGIAQWQEIITKKDMQFDAYMSSYGSGSYAYCADADADEALKFINPPDGDYIVKVLGFTVNSAPGFFDLEVKTIFAGVEGYKLENVEKEYVDEDNANGNYLNTSAVKPFEVRTFNVLWAFPSDTKDDTYGGIFVLGIPESQKLIVFSIDIVLDREAPIVTPEFTGPNSIVSTNTPTISAKIEDLAKGEIDPYGAHVEFDGVDITEIATVSIPLTPNSAEQDGFWTGDIVYKPNGPLSEGGHHIKIQVKDKTGNERTVSWGFTVDTTKPTVELSNTDDVIYTNMAAFSLEGKTEPSSIVSVIGAPNIVRQRIDNSFSIDLELEPGSNFVSIKSTDLAGNVYEAAKNIILDTQAPTFKRVVALDGSNTNKRMTGIYGEMSEAGVLHINDLPVTVNSDGTFRYEAIQLIEGRNQQVLKFTDRAGNVAYNYMNITMDTAAPTLRLAGIEKTVYSESLNITGETETGVASLTINGKLVSVDGSGNFQQNIRLSPGTNTIVIESKDRAGNSAQEVLTVNYVTDTVDRNWAAIGLMVALLVIGLILGLFLAPFILGKGKEPVPEEDIPAEEIPEVDAPAGDDMPVEDIPEMEDVPAEDAVEEVPEVEGEPVEAQGDIGEVETEPIPVEESMPEEIPAEETAPESEELPEEPAAPAEPEDPRIVKLRDAYESGKISKELYEKNLAKFQGQ
jgi:parallel beta-helix repeat protein